MPAEAELLDVLTFGPELPGADWYPPERMAREHDGLAHYRWCGRKPQASLRFIARDAAAVALVCDCVSVIHAEVLDGLSFAIDGIDAVHRIRRTGASGPFTVEIDGARSADGALSELVIRLDERRSPEKLAINQDARMLALAVKRVKVFAQSRPS